MTISLKTILWKVLEMSRSAHKSHVHNLTTPHRGGMMVSFLKYFARNYVQCQELNRKLIFGNSHQQFTEKFFFTRNCIQCPELYRKVMFANAPCPYGRVNLNIKFSLLGLSGMSRSAQQSHVSQPHLHASVDGKGCGQFTKPCWETE